ncbi:MAG: heavy-metal-associated domain-containing protein [Desulfobacterales bacterium]|nr:MAG: heavy-metal-associated domain-containing protein [Desulfobacterales bacterium]
MGEAALEGLKGVELVNSGFHNFKETNTVWYNPALINIDEMEKALKDAGTYLGTAK